MHYIQGITGVLILLNLSVMIMTFYHWVENIEFDNHRNVPGTNAMDLGMWEVLQTIPTLGYLSLCYTFFTEIKSHYVNQNG